MKKFILGFVFGGVMSLVGTGFVSLMGFGWILTKLEKHPNVLEGIKNEIVEAVSNSIRRKLYGAQQYDSPISRVPYARPNRGA